MPISSLLRIAPLPRHSEDDSGMLHCGMIHPTSVVISRSVHFPSTLTPFSTDCLLIRGSDYFPGCLCIFWEGDGE